MVLQLKTWKKITVGNIGSARELKERLERCEVRYKVPERVFEQLDFEKTERQIELVRVTADIFDLPISSIGGAFGAKIAEYGLTHCPHETIFQLALRFRRLGFAKALVDTLAASRYLIFGTDPINVSWDFEETMRLSMDELVKGNAGWRELDDPTAHKQVYLPAVILDAKKPQLGGVYTHPEGVFRKDTTWVFARH